MINPYENNIIIYVDNIEIKKEIISLNFWRQFYKQSCIMITPYSKLITTYINGKQYKLEQFIDHKDISEKFKLFVILNQDIFSEK